MKQYIYIYTVTIYGLIFLKTICTYTNWNFGPPPGIFSLAHPAVKKNERNWYFILPPGPRGLALHIFKCCYRGETISSGSSWSFFSSHFSSSLTMLTTKETVGPANETQIFTASPSSHPCRESPPSKARVTEQAWWRCWWAYRCWSIDIDIDNGVDIDYFIIHDVLWYWWGRE